MQLFADKSGNLLDIAGGSAPVKEPEGTALRFTFDEHTNPGLARLVGEQVEWPNVLVTEDAIYVHGNPWPINPDGDVLNQQKETRALVGRLYSDDALSDADVRALFRLLISPPPDAAASVDVRPVTRGRRA